MMMNDGTISSSSRTMRPFVDDEELSMDEGLDAAAFASPVKGNMLQCGRQSSSNLTASTASEDDGDVSVMMAILKDSMASLSSSVTTLSALGSDHTQRSKEDSDRDTLHSHDISDEDRSMGSQELEDDSLNSDEDEDESGSGSHSDGRSDGRSHSRSQSHSRSNAFVRATGDSVPSLPQAQAMRRSSTGALPGTPTPIQPQQPQEQRKSTSFFDSSSSNHGSNHVINDHGSNHRDDHHDDDEDVDSHDISDDSFDDDDEYYSDDMDINSDCSSIDDRGFNDLSSHGSWTPPLHPLEMEHALEFSLASFRSQSKRRSLPLILEEREDDDADDYHNNDDDCTFDDTQHRLDTYHELMQQDLATLQHNINGGGNNALTIGHLPEIESQSDSEYSEGMSMHTTDSFSARTSSFSARTNSLSMASTIGDISFYDGTDGTHLIQDGSLHSVDKSVTLPSLHHDHSSSQQQQLMDRSKSSRRSNRRRSKSRSRRSNSTRSNSRSNRSRSRRSRRPGVRSVSPLPRRRKPLQTLSDRSERTADNLTTLRTRPTIVPVSAGVSMTGEVRTIAAGDVSQRLSMRRKLSVEMPPTVETNVSPISSDEFRVDDDLETSVEVVVQTVQKETIEKEDIEDIEMGLPPIASVAVEPQVAVETATTQLAPQQESSSSSSMPYVYIGVALVVIGGGIAAGVVVAG